MNKYIIMRVLCSRPCSSLQVQELRLQFCLRQVFHRKLRNQAWNFTRDSIGAVASRYSPHSTLSLASRQIWKDPRGTNVEVRSVDLSNRAIRTSPKFTTGVKYQLHQGFWPDQRSENPNHFSPPYIFTNLTTKLPTFTLNWGEERAMWFPNLWPGQKPWWNWYLTPVVNFSEVRKVQLAKSTLLTSTFVSLESFKICSDIKERLMCGKQREATAPIESLVKLQPWFLSLRWKICLRQNCSLGSSACSEEPALGKNTLMMTLNRIYITF